MIGEKTIVAVEQKVERDYKNELREQGHYLTGETERLIDSTTQATPDGAKSEMSGPEHLETLETGLRSNQIDTYDPAYIAGMTEYVKRRFGVSSDRQALRIVMRIARKHRTEGMPTAASYQYSLTGERVGSMEDSYTKNAAEYEDLIEEGISKELDDLIDETFDQTIF